MVLDSSYSSGGIFMDNKPQDVSFFGHPRGLATLFFTEMWERFSYYGMRAILLFYMYYSVAEGGLGFDKTTAASIMSIYGSLVYLSSVIGGFLSDRVLGSRKTVFIGGVLIMFGHIALATPFGRVALFVSIALIVIGTGLLKPNVSGMVGDLYSDTDPRRDAGFSIFVFGINMGAFIAPIAVGYLGQNVNFHLGFSLAAIGMFFGLVHSTSQYREKYKPMYDEQHAVITPEIRSILPMKVFCIEVGEKYKDELRYKLIWDRLTNYARQRNEEKSNDKFVSLSMDDPAITPIDKCRFYLGVIIDNKENDFQPGVIEVPGGRYAIFRHIGDYSLLHKFYRTIYEEWFPESKYRPQSTFSFEMYMNRPASTLRTELITDIYIPVIKK